MPALDDSDGAIQSISVGIPGISTVVADRACPRCGAALNAAQYGAARRWGKCPACRSDERTDNI